MNMNLLLGFIVGVMVITFYFLPTLYAFGKSHPHTLGIAILNLFLGWTLLGWVGALVWAVVPPKQA